MLIVADLLRHVDRMVSRHLFVRVLEAMILRPGHSLFQLPELLSRLPENRAKAYKAAINAITCGIPTSRWPDRHQHWSDEPVLPP